MPTTRKQKRARKSTEADMLSDIKNLDIMFGGKRFEREESESSNFGRRPDSPCYDTSVNKNTNSHSNSREAVKNPVSNKISASKLRKMPTSRGSNE